MPGTSEPANTRNHAPPTSTSISKTDQADLEALNAAVDRVRTFTAQDPYILTIPQDEPRYHHAYQYQATQWLHLAPFELKEGESTQYQTFVYHEHGKDMFLLRNSQPRDAREAGGAKGKPATGANTPSVGPKKKISLNAYKKKQAGAGTPKQQAAPAVKQVDAPVKQAAVKGPVERVRAETEEVLAAVEDVEVAPVDAVLPVKQDLKRKREEHKLEENVVEDQQAAEPPVASQEEPVAKKARTTSHPSTAVPLAKAPSPTKPMEAQPETPSRSPARPQDAGLPPRLSPLRADPLPPRLSPTIPANMEATIKAREQLKVSSSDNSAPGSATKTKTGTLTPPRPSEGITKRKSPIPRNAFRANSSSPAVRSDVEEKERSKPAVTSAPQPQQQPQRAQTPPVELSQDEEIAVGRALKATAKPNKPASMVVKLKFKKHQREAVRRILRMRPKTAEKTAAPAPKPAVEEPSRLDRPSGRRRDPAAKGVAQRIGPPARNKQPEIKRYEPPGRRKDSTAAGVEGVGEDVGLGKRKRGVEEQKVKATEVPSTRQEEPAVKETPSQDPPAKRQKVPDSQQDDAGDAPRSQEKADVVEDQEPPAKRQKVPDPQRTEKEELSLSRSNAANVEGQGPPSKQLKESRGPPPGRQQQAPEQQEVETQILPRSNDTAAVKDLSEEPPARHKVVPVEQPKQDEPATNGMHVSTAILRGEKRFPERNVSSEVNEPASMEPASQSGEPEEKPVGVAEPVSTKSNDPPIAASVPPKESPFKRKKIPEAIETTRTPSTPMRPDLQSPLLQTSTQKSQQVTPTLRKDHLSAVAMAREASADGNVNTPSSGASSTPVTTNGITSQPNGLGSKAASGHQVAVRTAQQQAWETEQKRLEALGRELKHAATAHLAKLKLVSSDPGVPSTEQKLAAVKSLESLLAYFLAFTSADEAGLAAEPRQSPSLRYWRTLHAFFPFVKHNCEVAPLLLGLACHLAVVFSAHILDIVHQYPPGKQQAMQDLVVDTHATLFKSAREADARLDCDGLSEHFPRSWERRVRVPSAGGETMTPGVFAGEYKLPVGVHTSPVRAARAGFTMLQEWIGKEGVEYELKLKL
ncbi:hypothetical protein B0A55_01601 [Friedmanniomyces simplex]|uniref:Uncharacterized protein n=1 Tax=Friedmanniomyces simplex TaxID=329884 RepID=A0A4U0XVV3_9PEZI|nr:hypothetical protein B0A55_01601 [Friedmanniomyces simplex]